MLIDQFASTWLQTSYNKSFPTDAFGSDYNQEEDTFFILPDLLNHQDPADLCLSGHMEVPITCRGLICSPLA